MTEIQWQDRMDRLLKKYDPFRNVELFEELVTECLSVTSWDEFQAWFSLFKSGGCFRGHRDATWNLTTTLERRVIKTWTVETGSTTTTTIEKVNPEENESALLRDFQRAAHLHCAVTPAHDQVVDWLALMQHHGAPTRMLDWTRSPYVALYFAMQEGREEEAALWAIDFEWLKERSNDCPHQHDKDCPDDSDSSALDRYISLVLLRPDNPDIIVSASPRQLNERMFIQQGRLLCALNHGFAFSTILLGMLIRPSIVPRQVVSRVVVKRDRRVEFLEQLRQMNIHAASLFPGLDGFARSLGDDLDISVAHQVEIRQRAFVEYVRSNPLRRVV